jgi:DNA-binding response OmpR family regulator
MALSEEAVSYRPELILSFRDPRHTAVVGEAFRQRGWRVHPARSGREVRALARELVAPTILLGTDQVEESGWLTCAKLRQEQPHLRVFLVAPAVTPERRRFAAFLGAAGLLGQQDDPRAVVRAVCGARLPAAG